MKKLLLFAFVAMIAMSANAQKNYATDIKTLAPKANAKMMNQSVMFDGNKSLRKSPAKADAVSEVAFVEISYGWLDDDNQTSYNVCNTVYITKSGEQAEYKGENYEKVKIEGLCQGYATVDGYMTDEKIVIPQQTCFSYKDYGDMFIDVALIVDNSLEYKEGDIVLVNDNGYWILEEENAYGLAIRMTGDYEGNVWNYSPYCTTVVANGVETGAFSTGEWTEYTNPIYIEESEDGDEIHVFNFYGSVCGSHIVMYPDAEDEENPNSVLIPTWQIIDATNSNYDQATYGYDFHILACDIDMEAGTIMKNEATEYINAEFKDKNVIGYVDKMYSVIFTNLDAENRGYYMGYQTGICFTLNEGEFKAAPESAGINEITVSNAQNGKKFNLAGQQVDKSFKGLVINNGKKFIQK